MQFDVVPNPLPNARRAYPYVAVLQHDLADAGRDRVVAFMAPADRLPRRSGRLLPIVHVGEKQFILLVPSLTSLPLSDLGGEVGSIAAHRDSIVQALDWLFLGV